MFVAGKVSRAIRTPSPPHFRINLILRGYGGIKIGIFLPCICHKIQIVVADFPVRQSQARGEDIHRHLIDAFPVRLRVMA